MLLLLLVTLTLALPSTPAPAPALSTVVFPLGRLRLVEEPAHPSAPWWQKEVATLLHLWRSSAWVTFPRIAFEGATWAKRGHRQ